MSGADLQETAGRIARIQQALYFAQQFLIAAAGRFQKRAALAGGPFFRSGQQFDHTVFFGENVDIHHIFPQEWCKRQGMKPAAYDSIINKTPLSYKTNRIIGGIAPSEYLTKLETGDKTTPPIERQRLDGYLGSHLIDPALLRANDFDAFMPDRQKRLLALIEQATGKAAYSGTAQDEGVDVEGDEDTIEAEMTVSAIS